MPSLSLRRPFALVFFFLRTAFLRPSCNPVLPVAGVFLLFFHAEGSLDRYHVALVFFLTAVAHAYTGGFFGDPREAMARGAGSPLERWLRPLPVAGGRIFLAYLAAALVYGLLVFAIFALLLERENRLPPLVGGERVEFPTADGDTLTVYRGFAVTPRGIQYPASVVVERSLFFDLLGRFGAGRPTLAAYYVVLFVYVAALQGLRHLPVGRLARLLLSAPLGVYLAAGIALFAEVILTPREAGGLVRRLAGHETTAILLVAAVLGGTAAATLAIARIAFVRLGGGGR